MKTQNAYEITYSEVIDDRGADEDGGRDTTTVIHCSSLLAAKREASSMYPQFKGQWKSGKLPNGQTEYYKIFYPEGHWYHDTLSLILLTEETD